MIDLRSDTVTRPTPEMRAAMAAADVGDDVYLEDPTVNRLQQRAAEIFGKEAALFVPSGTMGNQIAVRLHTSPGQEVITEERGHIYNYEMAAMAVISGVLARPLAAEDGILSWARVRPAIRPKIYYRAQTGLITLENTHNMAGGTVYTPEQIEDVCGHAHDAGIAVHLDGARLFNAAVAQGTDVAALCRPCDSVMSCLSKGLGAPVGSLLLGRREFIERARSVRKMLGGGMRQAGVLAAAGLIALEKMPARLSEDHAHARLLAELLGEIDSLDLNPTKVRTNIVVVGISRTGLDSAQLASLLQKEGVLIGTVDPHTIRLLT
ncbi:MAG: threonine aldolase family protein, partial [Gammaproteobacteria bacterium]